MKPQRQLTSGSVQESGTGKRYKCNDASPTKLQTKKSPPGRPGPGPATKRLALTRLACSYLLILPPPRPLSPLHPGFLHSALMAGPYPLKPSNVSSKLWRNVTESRLGAPIALQNDENDTSMPLKVTISNTTYPHPGLAPHHTGPGDSQQPSEEKAHLSNFQLQP